MCLGNRSLGGCSYFWQEVCPIKGIGWLDRAFGNNRSTVYAFLYCGTSGPMQVNNQ